MQKKTITAHMIVKNEDKWVWFAIMSVIDFVDRFIIFSHCSTDRTVQIIRSICEKAEYADKIIFEEKNDVKEEDFWKLRQEQLDRTDTDYMMIVDGDEIWWEDSLRELREILDRDEPELVTTHFINCGGDIFHYRDSAREHYHIDGMRGAYTNRVFNMRMRGGIYCRGYYGTEGYCDADGRDIQNNGRKNSVMKTPYLHMSLLTRSSQMSSEMSVAFRWTKLIMRGTYDYAFPKDFAFPEALYLDRPAFVDDPWKKNRNIIRIFMQILHDIKFLSVKSARESMSGKEFDA